MTKLNKKIWNSKNGLTKYYYEFFDWFNTWGDFDSEGGEEVGSRFDNIHGTLDFNAVIQYVHSRNVIIYTNQYNIVCNLYWLRPLGHMGG